MKKISKEEKYKMLDKAQKKYNSFATNKLPGGLSPMQEKFCMEFLSTGDTLMAYRAAANELLKKERIGARIDDLRQEAVKHMGMLIERKEIKQDITNKSPEELEREIKHYENVVKLESINGNKNN